MTPRQFCFVSCVGVVISSILTHAANGQIIPDGTTDTSVTNSCQNSCDIRGGTFAGNNLFHSFDNFNIGAGESAYFTDPGVNNIFGRITGNNASNILGTLGVSGGDANLWLLNPNGIIFGAGASLDVNGSFLATTANEIQFGNDNFAATPNSQENLALLNINPSALFFNQMGQNQPININSGTILQIPNGKSLSLVGGQPAENIPGVNLEFGGLFTFGGNVVVGAIADGGTIDIDDDFHLSFPDDVSKGDISLSQGSGINVSGTGGGNVSLQGDDISLTGASNIFSSTTGDIDGGTIDLAVNNLTISENSTISTDSINSGSSSDINITANESINLVGSDVNTLQQLLSSSISKSAAEINNTSINTVAQADGASGDITINSPNLNLHDGAWILATTISEGNAGDIDIKASDTVTLDGSGLITGTANDSQGNAGNVKIDSNNLLLQNGGVISSSSVGAGKGGDVTLNVADAIKLRQSLTNGFIPTGIFAATILGEGAAGNIKIDTSQLTMEDGAELSSASGTFTNQGAVPVGGHGGNIIVNATDFIEIRGISPDNRFPSGIINRTLSNSPAGDITIHTGKLDLRDEAIISASSIGTGAGGDLTIVADESIHLKGSGYKNLQSLFLEGIEGEIEARNLTGGLFTNTQTGEAGNTRITSPSLTLENGALISTSTFGAAAGGNVEISAQDIKVSASLLASSTVGNGRAGNITIETNKLTTSDSGLITTSSTGLGNAGNLKVSASDFIELIDVNNSNLVFGGLVTNSLGLSYSGNLEIDTQDLTIAGGAKISASNGNQFAIIPETARNTNLSVEPSQLDSLINIIINAESINITGTSVNQLFTSGISSSTSSVFPASNIEINTNKLAIANRGEISVSSFGEGEAGNLNIVADSVEIANGGSLNATTISGRGGNIELRVNDILLLDGKSEITTNGFDVGNGGNIYIDTNFAIAFDSSNISATAISGNGGNIQVDAQDLFIHPDSKINASSQLGIDGQISIKTFDNSDRSNLAKLPETTVQTDSEVVKTCGNNNNADGVFSYTGRGGLPANLLNDYSMGDRNTIADLDISDRTTKPNELAINSWEFIVATPDIVEAAAWKINRRGNLELVTEDDNFASRITLISQCPFYSRSN